MDLHLELPGDHYYIRGLGPDGVRIGQQAYSGPVLVSPARISPGWPPATAADVELPHLQWIFDLQPEVVLMGTGATQVFLPQAMLYEFYKRGIGVEVMTTEAACRTFNVLVSEGRQVVAALLPVINPHAAS